MSKGRVLAVAAGVPVVLLAVLVVEGYIAGQREYLPGPTYQVTGMVVGAERSGTPLRLAFLGDSTIAGIGSPTVDESLIAQVAQRVSAELERPVTLVGLGESGARTATVTDEQVPLVEGGDFDAVVIVVGSNDVTHATGPKTMQSQTAEMLAAAQAVAGGVPVILGGIPLFGSASAVPQPLRLVIDTYADPLRNAQRTAAAAAQGVSFVDISALASPRFRGVPEAMSRDGFHPSPIGYGFWADALAPAVVAALSA